jgi:hypothetical protein
VLGLAALAIPVLICVGIFQVFRKPSTDPAALYRRQVALDKRLGWVSNPPPGVSWFREDGERKRYDAATGIWS